MYFAYGPGCGDLYVYGGVTDNTYGGNQHVNGLYGNGTVNISYTTTAHTLTVGNGNANGNFSGEITNLTNFVKTGLGTQVLSGANTYTGGTTVNGGTLALDFSQPGAPASNILYNGVTLSGGTGALTLGGAALNVTGNSLAISNSQAFSGVTFNAGASAVTATQNGAANLLIALGAVSARSTASAVRFTLPTGTQSATNGITTTSSLLGNNVAVSSSVVLGVVADPSGSGKTLDWATQAGSNIVGLGAASGYNTNSFTTTDNSDVTSNQGPAAFTVNTLRFNTDNVTLTLSSGSSTVTTGGILVTDNAGTQGVTLGGSGTLVPGSGGKELVVYNYGKLNVNVPLADNGTSAVTFAGTGTTILGAANTYAGQTYLDSGVLKFTGPGTLGTAAAQLNVNGGTLDLNGVNVGTGNLVGAAADNPE